MSIFDRIKHAIFGDAGPLGGHFLHPDQAKPAAGQPAPAAAAQAAPAPNPAAPTAPAAAAPQAAQPVDVEAILTQKAQEYGKPNNWRTSIVDLLTLLGLDSSLAARKDLADELNVHVGADGSAEENIALHKAVMKALAANGGTVPVSLTD